MPCSVTEAPINIQWPWPEQRVTDVEQPHSSSKNPCKSFLPLRSTTSAMRLYLVIDWALVINLLGHWSFILGLVVVDWSLILGLIIINWSLTLRLVIDWLSLISLLGCLVLVVVLAPSKRRLGGIHPAQAPVCDVLVLGARGLIVIVLPVISSRTRD